MTNLSGKRHGELALRREVRAMTLVELLVSISVVLILGVIGSGVYSNAVGKAALAREMQAAKTLITAYNTYAADHNGHYMVAIDSIAEPVEFPGRNAPIAGLDAYKYPFRLAPYFGYKLDGVIYVNKNKEQIDKLRGAPSDVYTTAMFPAMGLNTLVGGNRQSTGKIQYPNEVLKTQAEGVSGLVVFVSAASQGVDGYFNVVAPYTTNRVDNWGDRVDNWKVDKDQGAEGYGNVAPRYGSKAVCAFLDGSVRTLTINELGDMRLWSKNAREQDNPNYTFAAGGGGR